jgi:ADP-dependent NAD(P)H-hydrate dehydratase / NAD(P)H-hydrate epimerase
MPASALVAAVPVAVPQAVDTALFDVAAIRRLEATALARSAPGALMQRAGLAAARLALATAPHARRVWVACGPGNNGGDGLECALHLHHWGRKVSVTLLPGSAPPQGDAALALERAAAAGVPIGAAIPAPGDSATGWDLAIDALLGIGACRAPASPMAAAIDALNSSSAPVLALDVPTGLDADTGRRLGTVAVRAHRTITYLAAKPGLFTGQGRDHAGEVWLDRLGIEIDPGEAPAAWLGGVALPSAPRWHADHKGSFGDVVVIGGAPGMAGAAELAARAAHAAGAGRVYLGQIGDATWPAQRPELMMLPRPWPALQHDNGWWSGRTTVVGCGGGDVVAETLPSLLQHATRLVIDADALNAIARDPTLRRQLAHRSQAGLVSVLTPHPLEAARLLSIGTSDVQDDRLAAARRLACELDAVVVLKGSGTVVAHPRGGTWINPTGGPALATPGSGDVLAGWIGGLWSAAGSGPDVAASADVTVQAAIQATRQAVALHGRVAEPIARGPLRAADLIEAMWRSRAGLGL